MNIKNIKISDEKISFVADNDSTYSIRNKIFISPKSYKEFKCKEQYDYYIEIINIFNNAIISFKNNSDEFAFNISHTKNGRATLNINKKFKETNRVFKYSYEINLDKFYDCYEWMIDIEYYSGLKYDLDEFHDVEKFDEEFRKIVFHLKNGSTITANEIHTLKFYNSFPNHYFNETKQLINELSFIKIKIKQENDKIVLCLVNNNNNIYDTSFLNL
jgi:hypothetical protein